MGTIGRGPISRERLPRPSHQTWQPATAKLGMGSSAAASLPGPGTRKVRYVPEWAIKVVTVVTVVTRW